MSWRPLGKFSGRNNVFRQNISQHRWYRHQAIINIRFVITLLLLMKLLMKMLVGLIML